MTAETVLELAQRVPAVRAFLELSAALGRDPLLIQASGGNTSIKDGGLLWVKASGKCLADAVDQPIMVPVDLEAVRAAVRHGDSDPVGPHVAALTSLRPSIETTLHALLPHRVVVHVHSVNALAWTTRQDARDAVAERLTGINWAWVPYCRPGLPLTCAVLEASRTTPDVLVLGNHGLVVGGADVTEAKARLDEAEVRLALPARALPGTDSAFVSSRLPDGFRLPIHPTIHGLATDPDALAAVRGGALYPDHVVFLGGEAPITAAGRSLAEVAAAHRSRYGDGPSYVLVEGAGTLIAETAAFGVEDMLACQAEVLARIPHGIPLRHLTDDEVAELMNWDAEKYRRTVKH